MLELLPEITSKAPAASPIYRRAKMLVGAVAAVVTMVLAFAAMASPGDVVALSGNEFSMSYRARASFDQNQTGRLVPLENLSFADADSGVNG